MDVKIRHPYIGTKHGICGGRPVIVGTRFTVRSVVVHVLHQGLTPEELVREFPHLTMAQIYDALSFYYDHKDEIDGDIAQSPEEALKNGNPSN